MKTSIVGYPRVGSLRELKFASEKYFRKEITETELQETAKLSVLKILKLKKKADWILFRQTTSLSMTEYSIPLLC